jgi:hypothetical protein
LATNESGHRLLAAVLLLVFALWFISLVWIVVSKRQPITVAREHGHRRRFTGSNHAKAS